jgi:hypothetical protein
MTYLPRPSIVRVAVAGSASEATTATMRSPSKTTARSSASVPFDGSTTVTWSSAVRVVPAGTSGAGGGA